MDDYEIREEFRGDFDADTICDLIKEVWKTMPYLSLYEVLDRAIAANLEDVSSDEMIELLQEYIHQNN